jgi:hypothetical protein
MNQQELHPAQKRRLSVRQDIISVILSRGELSKDDIKLMWGLDENAYADLKTELAEEKVIEAGPRGSGGFSVKFKRRPKAPDETATAPILGTAWEQTAAARLAESLSHAELEELLGNLEYTIRRARAQATGEDPRGNKG